MSSSNLIRVGAIAAILGGVLLFVADAWSLLQELLGAGSEEFSEIAQTSTWTAMSVMFLSGGVLLLIGLIGLYARQSEEAGILGLVGFLAALVSMALVVGAFWALTFAVPSAAIEAPAFLDAEQVAGPLDLGFMVTFSSIAVGWALFGVATFRTRVYPRVAAVVLTIGALITFAPLPATTILFDVAMIWMGLISLRAVAPSVEHVGGPEAQPQV